MAVETPAQAKAPRVPRRLLIRFVALVVIVVTGFVVLRFTPLSGYLTKAQIQALVKRLRAIWWAPLALIASYIVLCPVGLPASPLMLAGSSFGFFRGFLFNLLGTWLGGVTTYFLGRILGRDFVVHLAGNRLKKVERAVARRGFWSLVTLRLLPIPYPLVNYTAALTGISPGLFMVTTFLGLIPANIVFAYFGDALLQLNGQSTKILQFVAVVALLVLFTVAPQIWMARQRKQKYLELKQRRSRRPKVIGSQSPEGSSSVGSRSRLL
ncbi:MAG TPA: TVP38/TMEM64 family protein [Thermoanaerobaculia bacterium]|nr:TVP38/TMEM64 family protein [Thermoanaerobaculia bacterium]